MNTETIEKLTEEVKVAFTKYNEKKTYPKSVKIRKALQALIVEARKMRPWVLEDIKSFKSK